MTQNHLHQTGKYRGSARQKIAYYVSILFYVVQVLLVFRFAFKLLGANPANRFVDLLYSTTAHVTRYFEGIFPEVYLENYQLLHVFEPSSVIALVVLAVIATIINRLLIGRDRAPAAPVNHADSTAAPPQNPDHKPE